jgi:hypothetical protein
MIVLRDEQRIARLRRISQYLNLASMAALVAGLVMIFFTNNANIFLYQLIALVVGWGLSQIGLYLAHRYLRDPRPDQVLDKAVRKAARKDGRLYHYLLPAPHVLLLPSGILLFVTKFQAGRISVDGDKWRHSGVGMRRFFAQEGLGNPSREAESQVRAMADYIRNHVPDVEVEDIPIEPVIVFTASNITDLDTKNSRIPAMHQSKLNGFVRQLRDRLEPLPQADYEQVRAAFDQKASHLLEAVVEETAGE